ncbi:MAG: 30S ribosomal protein S14 [Deltaproteobacteria bacterium]|nr:30S ribosomal protein S14 [Deltaproteobacteria bacterium]
MARNCQLAREVKREKLVRQQQERRDALRKAQIDPKLSGEERLAARLKLNSMKRDSSPTRLTRRCQATGAARAVYRKFKLNRISFRDMALKGLLPGVTKASW